MIRHWNPDAAPAPAARYSQCATAHGPGKLVAIAGQVGVRPDGTLEDGIDAQCRRALLNVTTILRANDLEPRDLLKISVFLVDRGHLAAYRRARDEILGDACQPPSTLVIVSSLAVAEWLVEVEALAFRED